MCAYRYIYIYAHISECVYLYTEVYIGTPYLRKPAKFTAKSQEILVEASSCDRDLFTT